jgi:hypothetical protein
MAFYLGTALSGIGIRLPLSLLAGTMVLFLVTALIYPSREKQKQLSRKLSYLRQKSCDFVIATCSFVMIATLVNSNVSIGGAPVYASNVITLVEPTAEEILASLKFRDKSTLTRQEKRILKREFNRQLKVYVVEKVKGNKDGAGKAGLIILTIIGALGLLYLVAALACTLSCNGSDVAAIIVGLLGLALIIWGTIALIRRITRGKKKEEEAGSK